MGRRVVVLLGGSPSSPELLGKAARALANALLLSKGVRRDAVVVLAFLGSAEALEVSGERVRNVREDEESTSGALLKMLAKGARPLGDVLRGKRVGVCFAPGKGDPCEGAKALLELCSSQSEEQLYGVVDEELEESIASAYCERLVTLPPAKRVEEVLALTGVALDSCKWAAALSKRFCRS